MLSLILFVLFCIIPELITVGVFILTLIFTDSIAIAVIASAIIYLFLFLTVKREIK